MNKVIFLTGLLTALLFIGTAHGRQFDGQAIELEELLMQNSNAEMETVDENEIAKALIQIAPTVDYNRRVKLVGCVVAKLFCKTHAVIIQTQRWTSVRRQYDHGPYVITGSKKEFCDATKIICK